MLRCEGEGRDLPAEGAPQRSGGPPSASTEAQPKASPTPVGVGATSEDRDDPHIDLPDPPKPPGLRSGSPGPKQDQSIFDGYGLPWHATAVHLCGKRLLHAGGKQSVWDAFWSKALPQKLVADYRKRLGERGFTAEAAGGIWKLPAGSPDPHRTLRILDAASSGEHQSCDERPSPKAKSVIILTRR